MYPLFLLSTWVWISLLWLIFRQVEATVEFTINEINNYEWNIESPHPYATSTTYEGPIITCAAACIPGPVTYVLSFDFSTETEYNYDTFYLYTLDSNGNRHEAYSNSGSSWQTALICLLINQPIYVYM